MADRHDSTRPAGDDPPRAARSGGGTSGSERTGRDGSVTSRAASSPTPATQQVGRVTIVVLAVLFGVFAVANAQFVDFSWIFGGTEVVESGGSRVAGGVPLIVLLLASFLLGSAVGVLLGWRRRRRHDHRADGEVRSTRQ